MSLISIPIVYNNLATSTYRLVKFISLRLLHPPGIFLMFLFVIFGGYVIHPHEVHVLSYI